MLDLGAPVRVTWDLPSDGEWTAVLWRRLCEGRVLFVDVLVAGDAAKSLSALAGLLERGGPRLTVTAGARELAAAREALGSEQADLQLLPEYPSAEEARALAAGARSFAPVLWCSPGGLRHFATALELARACGFPAVGLLNPPCSELFLEGGDRERAAAVWRESRLAGRVELRVHDLFLAEALGFDPLRDYAGCQAGGYLAHLTAEGVLTACRTCPVPLGNLLASSLSDLWKAPARRDFRSRVAQIPEGCDGCSVARTCLGGCRGYAPGLGRDPSCPGQKGSAI